MLTTWIVCDSWPHFPDSNMNPAPTNLLSTLRDFSFQTQRIPPAELAAGYDSQLNSELPHRAWHKDLLIFSIFVSWMHNRSIWFSLTSLLIAGHLIPLPNPLMLYEMMFMGSVRNSLPGYLFFIFILHVQELLNKIPLWRACCQPQFDDYVPYIFCMKILSFRLVVFFKFFGWWGLIWLRLLTGPLLSWICKFGSVPGCIGLEIACFVMTPALWALLLLIPPFCEYTSHEVLSAYYDDVGPFLWGETTLGGC